MKIETKSTITPPASTVAIINGAFDVIPKEHLRGMNRVVLVDHIQPDTRINLPNISDLPGLYHPKMANVPPWCEIALGVLLPQKEGFLKRIASKLNYKANLAGLVLSLQAQHYYFTLSHGIKKNQYEGAIRSYVEKYHEQWRDAQGGWRVKLFKPLRPYLDKWARSLRKRYESAQAKKA